MRRPRILLALLLAACAAAPTPGEVPVHVVAEHHEVLPVWRRAAPAGATLLHFDAHEDFGIPDGEPDVADFVVPAILEGLVSDFVWVTPPWLAGEPPRDAVGRIGGGGASVRYRHRVVPLARLPIPDGPFLLDVDLDFFACENPHRDHGDVPIDAAEYRRRLAGGEVRLRGTAREGDVVTESVVLARPPGPYSWPVRLDRIRDTATGGTRYLRGFVCLGAYRDAFPVHRPDAGELARLVGEFRAALGRLDRPPALVTISRSATSGFVPADRVDSIEAAVRGAIRDAFRR